MLLGIIGDGVCAGRRALLDHLVKDKGFTELRILPESEGYWSSDPSNDGSGVKAFQDPASALEYATAHWRSDLAVIIPDGRFPMESYQKRPFFLLACMRTPLLSRYRRWRAKHERHNALNEDDEGVDVFDSGESDSLERFLFLDQARQDLVAPHLPMADVTLKNNTTTLSALSTALTSSTLLHAARFRPDWDTYFIRLCRLASTRSNCMKRRVGCILAKDRKIVATGYNGTPRGVVNCAEGGCGRCNGGSGCGVGLEFCLCLHAEENALLEVGRERVAYGGDTVLYCTTCPCIECARKIVQTGVKEVVYSDPYAMDELTFALLKEAKIPIRRHTDVENTIVLVD
ncbi:Deoxycytidine monophosphate (dCMP) deaminase [Irineochytrium annulatum]|nr:Deoxycytidine monophosphate (dCMP) deaminase [Irineochytrium annulatum]